MGYTQNKNNQLWVALPTTHTLNLVEELDNCRFANKILLGKTDKSCKEQSWQKEN